MIESLDPPIGMPDDLDPRQFETDSQRYLREEFDAIEVQNRVEIDAFDPDALDQESELRLDTTFPELENADPQIAALKRQAMLRNLGVIYTTPDADGSTPDAIWSSIYSGGVVQYRMLRRVDGTEVPIEINVARDDSGRESIVGVNLQSRDRMQSVVDRHKEAGELEDPEPIVVETVPAEGVFDFDESVVQPDLEKLAKIRRKFARTIMPGNLLLSALRRRKRDAVTAEYEAHVVRLVQSQEFGIEEAGRFIQDENEQRHAELNKQLRLRRAAMWAGKSILGGGITAVVTAAGFFDGAVEHLASSSPIIESLVGAAVGLAFTAERLAKARTNSRLAQEFEKDWRADWFDQQLSAERKRAESNEKVLTS